MADSENIQWNYSSYTDSKGRTYIISYYNKWDAVKKQFESSEGEAIDDDAFADAWATCLSVTQKKDGCKGVIIHYSKRLADEGGCQMVSTISHEAVHAANMILREIGVNYTKYDDEHFAYLVGWVARKSWSVLQETICK